MKKMLLFFSFLILIGSAIYYSLDGDSYIKKYLFPMNSKSSTSNMENTKTEAIIISNPPADAPRAEAPAEKYLVAIDAGHGGVDPGTSGGGLDEKDIALDISLRLEKLLKDNGTDTYMTRTEDVFMDHKERILLANDKNASLFISIHCDWFNNPAYGGTQTLYYPSTDLKNGNLSEIQYAKIIQNELIQKTKVNDRGIIDRPNLAVLRHAKMPSVIVELGFLSNKTDVTNLGSTEYRQKVAEGLANGIIKALASIKPENIPAK